MGERLVSKYGGYREVDTQKVMELIEMSKGITQVEFILYKDMMEDYFKRKEKELTASIKIEDDKFLQPILDYVNEG